MRFIFIATFILLVARADAAIVYVDGDSGCPGTGATGTPYCTIQNGLNHSGLTAGDTIRIRNSSNPYNETASRSGSPSGTLAAPIVIEPDVGHTPVITNSNTNAQVGAINLTNVSYWTVRGALTFNGTGIQTSKYAVRIEGTSAATAGGVVDGITVTNWGGDGRQVLFASAIFVGGVYNNDSLFMQSPRVENVIITGSRTYGIRLRNTRDAIARSNHISGQKCGINSVSYLETVGIKSGGESFRDLIDKNHIHDFELSANCGITTHTSGAALTGDHVLAGYYCDAGPENGVVSGNEIYKINDGNTARGNGIFLESRCDGWRVIRNLVRDVGRWCFKNGSSTLKGANNRYEYNICLNAGSNAMMYQRGLGGIIRNNIFTIKSTGVSVIEIQAGAVTDGNITINGNLYYDGGSNAKIGRWGNFSTLAFAAWKTACGCDAGSPTPANPQFVSATNLSLTSTSPAIDACVNIGFAFAGSAPDCGAYETIVLPANSGEVGLVAANKIVLNFGIGVVASPLAASDFATGWTGRKNGSNNVITSVVASGNQLTFTMTDSYAAGDTADLSYNATTGNLTDSSPFQNKQKFFSVTNFAITNNIQSGGGGGTANPVVERVAASESGATVTSLTVTKPTGLASGDKWLVIVGVDGSNVVNWPSADWQSVVAHTYSATNDFSCEARFLAATGGEGASIVLTAGTAQRWAALSLRISGAHASSAIQGSAAVGTNGTADPPDFNAPGWGAENALSIGAACAPGSVTFSDDPDGYADLHVSDPSEITSGAVDNGVTVRAVQKAITADSENPATFTFDNTGWIAMTIAVRPEAETTPVANWELKNCAWLGYYSSLSTPVWVRPEGAANDMNVPPGGAALLACGIAVNLEDAEQTTIEWVTTKNGGGQAQITNNPAANGISWGGSAFTILNGQSIESPLPDLTISPYSFISGAVRGSAEFNPSVSLLTNTLTQFILILQIHRTAAVPTDRFCFIPKRPNNVDISLAIAAPCLEVVNPGTIR